MKNVRTLAFVLTLAASAASVACSGGTTTDAQQPQTSASALTKAPVGVNTHGMVRVVGEAFGEVALRADQRAELEKLVTEAETRQAATVDARKDLMVTIADQVEKGSVDRTALQPKIDALVAVLQKNQADHAAAMTKAHALLDADQRSAFVDALHAKMKAA